MVSSSWIVLDEAHERTVNTDILFGVVKAAVKGHGPLLLTLTLVCSTFEEKSLPSSSASRTRIYTRVHPQNSLISQGMLDLTGSENYCW